MKLTIITVCYNASATILDAMTSVDRQKVDGFELEYIIVDGASKDDTCSNVRHFADQKHENMSVRWISEPDSGLYDAMNKGLRMATGDVVGILNADDMMNWVIPKPIPKFSKAV